MIAAAAAPRIDPAILEPALVQLTRNEARVRRVGITAVQTGEGVSTLARELAGAYARRGRSAVLIDSGVCRQYERPIVSQSFK